MVCTTDYIFLDDVYVSPTHIVVMAPQNNSLIPRFCLLGHEKAIRITLEMQKITTSPTALYAKPWAL